jgi:hypothetical protein
MEFSHSREYLDGNQYVRVDCDTQCNVLLTDDVNYGHFTNGRSYRYYGGFFKQFPAMLVPPYPGYWNITLDLGGGTSATVRYSIEAVTIQP